MSDCTVLVTGANRGIGLAFCKHYSDSGATVYAACREASAALRSLNVHTIEGVDIGSSQGVDHLARALQDIPIHILINNAGVLRNEVLGDIDYDSIIQQFHINALGPLRVSEALLGNLCAGAKIAFITSRMGSIADNTSGGRYGYRMSKCALNIAGVSLAHDLKDREIAVGIFHPGLVGTDMIGGHGDITPDEAALRLKARIDALNMSNTGTFWHSNGDVLPW